MRKVNWKSISFPFTLRTLVQGIRYCFCWCTFLLIGSLMLLKWGSVQATIHSESSRSSPSSSLNHGQAFLEQHMGLQLTELLWDITYSSCPDSRTRCVFSFLTQEAKFSCKYQASSTWEDWMYWDTQVGSDSSMWVPVCLFSPIFSAHLSLWTACCAIFRLDSRCRSNSHTQTQ